MSKKIGRPKVAKAKALGHTFGARFRPDEEKLIRRAMHASGVSQSEWIRDALLEKAHKG